MSINMNAIPSSKPAMNSVFPKGRYHAVIRKAEMKQPNDPEKPMYYSAECDITDPATQTKMGKFWVRLFDSDKSLVLYQIGRFLTACGLHLEGEFELKDLTKITVGKEFMVDLKPEERKDGKPPQQSVVDIDAECFYPVPSKSDEAELEALLSGDVPQTPEPPAVHSTY